MYMCFNGAGNEIWFLVQVQIIFIDWRFTGLYFAKTDEKKWFVQKLTCAILEDFVVKCMCELM